MTITVRLPEELEAELRTRFDAQGFGLSKFVRTAIAEKLDREAAGRPSAYKLGKNVFGKHGSGRDDLSTNRKVILGELLRPSIPFDAGPPLVKKMQDDLDVERSTILRDLIQVGPSKPVGYLPLYTIRDVLQMEPHALARDAEARGLSAALFGPDQCCIKSGALYLFDRPSLEHLMQSSRPILSASRWPLDPDQFVARIAREWIDRAHPVASVIRRAFGEQAA